MIPHGRWEGGRYVLDSTADARSRAEGAAAERKRMVEALTKRRDDAQLPDLAQQWAHDMALDWAIQQITNTTENDHE